MLKLWLALLTTCCLSGAEKNSSNPYRLECLYEKFNSTVTSMEGAKGVWHIVRGIPILNSSLYQNIGNPRNAVTVNIRLIKRDYSYLDTFIGQKPGKCMKVPLFLYKEMRENGDSFCLHRPGYFNGSAFLATVYPLYLEPNSTALVWYRHTSLYPDFNAIFVLSRFHSEVIHMDRVNETLRAFCPDIGPSVDWRVFPQARRDLVDSPDNCTISHGLSFF